MSSTAGVQNLLIKREANIKAALALKAQLQDSEGMLESQNHALNLRIDQLSGERDRMAGQIAALECDLRTAVAAKGCLAVEKSSAEQRLRVSPRPRARSNPLVESVPGSTARDDPLLAESCARPRPCLGAPHHDAG